MQGQPSSRQNQTSVLDFTMTTIDEKTVPLSTYKGKVLLLVNVASRCGYTPQYKNLEALYEKYKAKGFTVLGFPANNFGAQEPGTNVEIKQFCTSRYNVTFDVFAKISVKGDDQHPLYRFLTSEKTNPGYSGPIKWNFQKFLVGRDGKVVGRFDSGVDPLSAEIVQAVEAALAR